MKWKGLSLLVVALELSTLVIQFGLPAYQGRIFGDPKFPPLIVFHGLPGSDIVDFRGNFFEFVLESVTVWLFLVFGTGLGIRIARQIFRSTGERTMN